MAQVNAIAYHPQSMGEALSRAFQMYQSLKQGQEAGSKADLADQETEIKKTQLENQQKGIYTPEEVVKAAPHFKSIGTVPIKEDGTPDMTAVPKGSLLMPTNNPQVTHFAVPEVNEFKAPNLQQKEIADPNNPNKPALANYNPAVGKYYDPTTGAEITNPQPFNKKDAGERTPTQDKAFNSVSLALESMRGNPAVQLAERDMYSSSKANKLIMDATGGTGDLNKMTPQSSALLVAEIGKMATGGAPTIHELDILTPDTFKSKFANIAQKVLGEPTDANVGEFLKQYKDYADGLTEEASKVITDRYGRIIDTHKSRLAPDDYKAFQTSYVDRFKDITKAAGEKLKESSAPQGDPMAAAAELKRRGVKTGGNAVPVKSNLDLSGVNSAIQGS